MKGTPSLARPSARALSPPPQRRSPPLYIFTGEPSGEVNEELFDMLSRLVQGGGNKVEWALDGLRSILQTVPQGHPFCFVGYLNMVYGLLNLASMKGRVLGKVHLEEALRLVSWVRQVVGEEEPDVKDRAERFHRQALDKLVAFR